MTPNEPEPTAGDGPQPDPTPEEDAASRAEQPDEVEEPEGHTEEAEGEERPPHLGP